MTLNPITIYLYIIIMIISPAGGVMRFFQVGWGIPTILICAIYFCYFFIGGLLMLDLMKKYRAAIPREDLAP